VSDGPLHVSLGTKLVDSLQVAALTTITAVGYYAPSYFLKKLLEHLEMDSAQVDSQWGWVWCLALFASNAILFIAAPLIS